MQVEELQTEPKEFVDAEITLQNWPTSFGYRAVPFNDQRAHIATNLARPARLVQPGSRAGFHAARPHGHLEGTAIA